MNRLKYILIGILIGAIAASAGFLLFGDQVRGDVANATQGIGRQVKGVGEKLEHTGKSLR
ncbi:MAG: hypothetical protein R3C68_00015 [Myxococcota bacterium]